MTASPALIVFAKVPEPGRVKTRLCPPLTPEQAATLYDAFLRDALDRYAGLDATTGSDPFGVEATHGPVAVRLYLAGVPPDGLVPPGVAVFRQRGGGLGDRMMLAFVETFAAGHDRAVVVGTDHPTLPLSWIGEAFRQLDAPMTAAIGPSEDGGYTFLGLNDVASVLFDMDYSHAQVFDDTLERIDDAGMTPVILPTHYDVDDASSLARLRAEARAGADVGPRTACVLGQW
ncbi:MAG: TIGR04282 family arsenosugar biosynthesis glycosyltransferase [Rubricoccaceae bacterium]